MLCTCPAQEAELLNMESDKDFDLVGAAALHMRTAACQYGHRRPQQLLLVCQQPASRSTAMWEQPTRSYACMRKSTVAAPSLQVRQVLSYERDRIRFLLKAYLRARLEKVQRFAGTWPLRQAATRQHAPVCVSHRPHVGDVHIGLRAAASSCCQ